MNMDTEKAPLFGGVYWGSAHSREIRDMRRTSSSQDLRPRYVTLHASVSQARAASRRKTPLLPDKHHIPGIAMTPYASPRSAELGLAFDVELPI